MNKEVFLSIVVPVYNEAESIPLFWARLLPVLDQVNGTSEVIFVNDGSSDGTVGEAIAIDDPRIRILSLSRNSGHMAALDAGFRASRGKWTVTIDGDLQHPPELITEMLLIASEQQVDVVYGIISKRVDSNLIKRFFSSIYYPVLRAVTGSPVNNSAGDFRLVSERVLKVLQGIPSSGQIYRLLIPSLGFKASSIKFVPEVRKAGKSKYSIRKILALVEDSMLSNSRGVLRMLVAWALVAVAFAAGFMTWAFVAWASGDTERGWTSLIALLSLFGAIQISLLAYLGLYLNRIAKVILTIPQYFSEELGRHE